MHITLAKCLIARIYRYVKWGQPCHVPLPVEILREAEAIYSNETVVDFQNFMEGLREAYLVKNGLQEVPIKHLFSVY